MSTRREFLTTALVGGAAAALAPRRASAAAKSMTVVHESSFIKPFDDFFVKTPRRRVREADRHQGQLRGGQRGQHAHPAHHDRRDQVRPRDHRAPASTGRYLFDQKLRRRQRHRRRDRQEDRRLARQRPRRGGRQRQVEGDARSATSASSMNYRTDWFKEVGVTQVPRHLGRPARGRAQAQEEGPSVRLRARPRLRRQPRLALSAAVVVRRARGRQGRQDRRSSIPTRPRARSTSAGGSTRRRCSRTCWAGPTSTTTRRSSASRSPAPTTPRVILWSAKRDFPEIAKVTDQALNPQGPKGRFHMLQPAVATRSSTHAQDQEAAKDFLRWLMTTKQLSRWLVAGDAYYAPFLHGYDNRRCGTSSRATCPTASR